MRSVIPTFFVILLNAFSNLAFAIDEQTTIDLEVVHIEYVKLIGTVVGATRTYDVSEVIPPGNSKTGPTVSLGMLGIESNVPGNCTLDFSSDNTFKLKHTVSNKRLTRYIMYYEGNKINRNNTSMVLPSCNVGLSSLDFVAKGNFLKANRREAGIYRDIVTITVTTE